MPTTRVTSTAPTPRTRAPFRPRATTVPFHEKEDKDAEVSYEKSGGTTGLVALKAECDNGRISVRITSRSA